MALLKSVFLIGVVVILEGNAQFLNSRPYPTYSLEKMPDTGFTCRDKILGGYYADSEAQCQMFHVCVKVAGVGVQDFRFLCPNGTAFDQDAQICADWGDVDCEASTLYYGSDNFDLYRISSDVESKRAPFAYEEEAPFHLQRAETGDHRLGKQSTVDQKRGESAKLKPRNPYSNQFNSKVTTHSQYESSNYNSQDQDYNQGDILKGSHSSNFFNNRNNGKEYDDYNGKPQEQEQKIYQRPPSRSRQRTQQANAQHPTQIVKSTPIPITPVVNDNQLIHKKVQKSVSHNNNVQTSSVPHEYYRQSTSMPVEPTTTNFIKYQTEAYRSTENYTPSAIKKFSTLVPRDNSNPTTFKPTTFKKSTNYFSQSTQKTYDDISTVGSQISSINNLQTTTQKSLEYQFTNNFAGSSYLPTTQKPTTNFGQTSDNKFTTNIQPHTNQFQANTNKQTTTKYNVNNQFYNSNDKKYVTSNNPQDFTVKTSTTPNYNSNKYSINAEKDNHYITRTNDQYSTRTNDQYNTRTSDQYNTRTSPQYNKRTNDQYKVNNEYNSNDDDGQYRPELYETTKTTENSQSQYINTNSNTKPTTKSPYKNGYYSSTSALKNNYETSSEEYIRQSDQGEFLKTAHSQNIAASGNDLRNKNKEATVTVTTKITPSISFTSKGRFEYNNKVTTSAPRPFSLSTQITTPLPQQNSDITGNKPTQYVRPTQNPPVTPQSTNQETAPKPKATAKKNTNASYDYAYYDNSDHFSEYDNIEEFGRTNKKQ